MKYPQLVAKARGTAHKTGVSQIVYGYRVGWFKRRKYGYCAERIFDSFLVINRPYVRLLKCMPNGAVVQ